MIFGFDTDNSEKSVCCAKQWDNGTQAAFLLTCTGSAIDLDGICCGMKTAVQYATALFCQHFEEISNSEGAADLIYAGTRLIDCGRQIHARVLELGDYSGQGIYLTGVATYFTAHGPFVMLPFGGGCLYISSRGKTICLSPNSYERIVRDAIGGSRDWQGRCWHGELKDNSHLIYTSAPIDARFCEQTIKTHSSETNHINTVSMLLRRELESKYPGNTTAVMELRI